MPDNYIAQIKAILEKSGISQVKLAKELGVTTAALNRWLNQQAKPRQSSLKAISQFYKLKVGILPLTKTQITTLQRQIDKEKRQHKKIKNILKDNKSLREELLLELTYNSNAIEGSTLTKKETETIIFDKGHIEEKSYIEHLEATNHATALEMLFNGDFDGPITENTLKKIHQILLQGIRSDAGKYSTHHRAIRGVELTLPSPEDIPEEMARLMKKIKRPKQHIVAHIAQIHADFEAIHPFGDGNGRTGRLLMILQLINAGYAPCLILNNIKHEYYECLEFAQKKSETHLIKFVIESIQKCYQLIRKHRK